MNFSSVRILFFWFKSTSVPSNGEKPQKSRIYANVNVNNTMLSFSVNGTVRITKTDFYYCVRLNVKDLNRYCCFGWFFFPWYHCALYDIFSVGVLLHWAFLVALSLYLHQRVVVWRNYWKSVVPTRIPFLRQKKHVRLYVRPFSLFGEMAQILFDQIQCK